MHHALSLSFIRGRGDVVTRFILLLSADAYAMQLCKQGLAFGSARAGGRAETDMAGDKISRVAAIRTGTIGARWTAAFLARGLTVAASDPASGAETFLHEFVGAAWPSLARLSPLPAEPPWALTFHTSLKRPVGRRPRSGDRHRVEFVGAVDEPTAT